MNCLLTLWFTDFSPVLESSGNATKVAKNYDLILCGSRVF
jgi:hypothetical protein